MKTNKIASLMLSAASMFASCQTTPKPSKVVRTIKSCPYAANYDVQMLYGTKGTVMTIGIYKGNGEGPTSFDEKRGIIVTVDEDGDGELDQIIKTPETEAPLARLAEPVEASRIYTLVRVSQGRR